MVEIDKIGSYDTRLLAYRNTATADWGSDGKRTAKPDQGEGGMVASVRGDESRNSPGLPSSEVRGTPVARSRRRQAVRIGRTARRPCSHPTGPEGASPEAAGGAPSSGQSSVVVRCQHNQRSDKTTVHT